MPFPTIAPCVCRSVLEADCVAFVNYSESKRQKEGGRCPACREASAKWVRCSHAALLALEFFIFLAEALDPTGRVDKFLFAGKERMALGADFNPDVFPGGTGFHHISTCALNGRLLIFRMNFRFHGAF